MAVRSKLSCGNGRCGGTARRRRAEPGHDVTQEGAEVLRRGEREPLLAKRKKKEGRSREIGMAMNSDELERTPA
jgi:hypothetical protein